MVIIVQNKPATNNREGIEALWGQNVEGRIQLNSVFLFYYSNKICYSFSFGQSKNKQMGPNEI